jgi:glycosyltransferase involved in cell wall biosynthesis
MSKKIAIICPHPERVAPGQRLKYEQYFQHWRDNGWSVDVYSFQSLRFWEIVPRQGFLIEKIFWTIVGYCHRVLFLFKIRNYDIVYIFLWVTPFGPPLFEWLYCLLAKKVVFDIDDLVFLGHSSAANSWISKLKGKNKPIYLMKHAHHVVTCTPYLDSFVKKYNKNTTDISSTIQTDKYQIKNSYQNRDKLTLGWSGSHSTAKYLYLIQDVLKELNQYHPFKLLVMGTDHFYIEGLEIECLKWCEDIEIDTIQRFDIGLYPLPDELWVHGKSGLKCLQYMACGVPTVAMNVGEAIKRVVTHQQDGMLVYSHLEWMEALKFLIENPKERKRMGENARQKVVDYYSIKANQDRYLNILNSVIAN